MRLLNIISNYFIAFSLIFFLAGSLVIYFRLVATYDEEVLGHLNYERSLIQQALKEGVDIRHLPYNVGDKIEIEKLPERPLSFNSYIADTLLLERHEHQMIECKHIAFPVYYKKDYYRISIYKSLLEKEEFANTNIVTVIVLLLFLVLFMIVLQRNISRWALKPFYTTLKALSEFDISSNKVIELEDSEIEEFHLLNKAINTLSEKIVRDYKNLKEFTENMSHELQTPLAIIRSNLEVLIQNEALNDKQRDQVDAMYESVNRLSKLNKGLMLLTSIENNQATDISEVDVVKAVKGKLVLFNDMITGKGITLSVVFNNNLVIKTNQHLADILISNLISNAVKYTDTNGKMNIMVTNQSLLVSNTSTRAALDNDKLFKRFGKGSESSSLGLGLAICKRIATHYDYDLSYFYEAPFHTFKVDFLPKKQE